MHRPASSRQRRNRAALAARAVRFQQRPCNRIEHRKRPTTDETRVCDGGDRQGDNFPFAFRASVTESELQDGRVLNVATPRRLNGSGRESLHAEACRMVRARSELHLGRATATNCRQRDIDETDGSRLVTACLAVVTVRLAVNQPYRSVCCLLHNTIRRYGGREQLLSLILCVICARCCNVRIRHR